MNLHSFIFTHYYRTLFKDKIARKATLKLLFSTNNLNDNYFYYFCSIKNVFIMNQFLRIATAISIAVCDILTPIFNKNKIFFSFKIEILFSLFLSTIFWSQAQTITNVQTASNHVIVVHLETDWINIAAYNRTFYYDSVRPMTSNWLVNNVSPESVGYSSTVIDEKKVEVVNGAELYPIKIRHTIYLSLSGELIENQLYNIISPYGNSSFTFREREIYCESIKVNQVGYAQGCSERYANFGIYRGTDGSELLTENHAFYVVDVESDNIVMQGTLSYWGEDTSYSVASSGEFVYRMNISDLPLGYFYIVIEGMGRSYPFGIGMPYSRDILRTHVRGMYHQRCGIALEEPYTNYTRGECHQEVAFTKYAGNGSEGEGFISVPADAVMHHVIGGYHDAGDFDRRVYHTTIPLLMLNFYEAFITHFTDNQYNIPESGNGIPDFLDEALWGVLIWENLQLDASNSNNSDEYGGVMGGTETSGHPTYGIDRADWENGGNQKYGTYAVYERTTLAAAGFFAQASRLLRDYDDVRSAELLTRAQLAWQYATQNNFNTRKGFKMYAALQLYLATATGDSLQDMQNTYHQEFLSIAQAQIINGGSWPYQYLPGNSAANIQTSHFISYLLYNGFRDENMVTALYNRLKQGTDQGGYMEWNIEDYPYPQGATCFIGYGAGSAQGRYAEPAAYMYRLSETADDKQKYYNIVSQLADYSLGLNPLGKCYVTGLGSNQVQSPLHLDSYFTKYGLLPQGGTQDAIGNVPGIVVYGFTTNNSSAAYHRAVTDFVYPAWNNLPGQRRWTDGWSAIALNEFTTHETMVWNTCMYSVLYDASQDTTIYSGLMQSELPQKNTLKAFPNPVIEQLTVIGNFGHGKGSINIFSIEGKLMISKTLSFEGYELEQFTIPELDNFPHGLYILRVESTNGIQTTRIVKTR